MTTIGQYIYHIIEHMDGEKGSIRCIPYKKGQAIKEWLKVYMI